MSDSELADQRDLMLRSGQQVGRSIGTQDLGRMRIERYNDGCSAGLARVACRSGNDRLMTEMHTIEDPNGEKERPGKAAQFRNRTQDLHRHRL